MTEPAGPAWRQPTFHPFAITSRLAAGQVLRVRADSPLLDTARFGEVPSVDAVATYDEETGKLAVFLVNRSVDGPIEVTLDTSRTPVTGVLEALGVHEADRLAESLSTR
jgi:alpha-N-arabinofuranosidase